jgi:hypothetical protein
MREIRPTAQSSLFRPVDASEVFVDKEVPLYDERRHWASLIQPFAETLGALTLITVAAARTLSNANLVIVVIGAAYLYYKWSNPPRSNKSARWPYGIFAAAAVYTFAAGGAAIGVAVILAVTLRFVLTFVEWVWYERLFITNRRVILAKGLLGSDFSTMPLTRLTDIKYNTSIPGEILGYASVHVETAGQDQALSRLNFLANPSNFYNTLIHLSTTAVGSVTEVTPEPVGQETDEGLEPDPGHAARGADADTTEGWRGPDEQGPPS